MIEFPNPRGIRKVWRPMDVDVAHLRDLLDREPLFRIFAGEIVSCRAWKIARGHGRGRPARIDFALQNGEQLSLRFLARGRSLRMGVDACR